MTRAADAWATRASSPVVLMHDGDSVTEGTGASGFEGKWTTKLLRLLQADAGISGGSGFVNSGSYSPTSNSLSGYFNPVPSVFAIGLLGSRSGSLAVDQPLTITFTGTSVDVHFFQGFTAAQPMTAVLDGGTPQTITVSTTGPQNFRGVWHSAVLSHGAHTLVLTPTAGNELYIRGIYVYDGDETAGVHGYEGGHFGSTSTDHAASLVGYYADATTLLQPALVTIFLGLNDMTRPVTPADYQASLTAIVASINSYCTVAPSYVICGPYLRVSNPATTYPLSQYKAAAQAVVATDSTNRRFVDLSLAGLTAGDMADDVHPNDAGHTKLAAAVRPAALDLAGVSAPPPVTPPATSREITGYRLGGQARTVLGLRRNGVTTPF